MRKSVFSSLKRPERLWGPQSFLFNRYQSSFPGGWGLTGRNAVFITYLHLVPRYRMSGYIVPLILYPFMSRRAKLLPVTFISTWELQYKITRTTHCIFTPYCLKNFDVFRRSVFLSGNAGRWESCWYVKLIAGFRNWPPGGRMMSYFAFMSEALAVIKPSCFITPLYYLSIVKINPYPANV